MSISLPTNSLLEIHQLVLLSCSYIPSGHAYLGKTKFCANTHTQLCHLCHVIQINMLRVYHCPTYVFCSLYFSFSALHQFGRLSQLEQCLVPLQLPHPGVVIATDLHPVIGPFIFRVPAYCDYSLEPG